MRLRRAPVVATWLLKLFSSSAEHEYVIGDLFEQYQRGRGRFWYWRQVIAIVVLRLCRQVRRLSVSANGIAMRQGVAMILFMAVLAAVLLSDIWILFLVGILGGIITGGLMFWLGSRQTDHAKSDRIYTDRPDAVRYNRGISMSHIPVEGAVGLLFVLGTILTFGSIQAVRQLLIVTGPLGILGLGILIYWHRHHPVKIQTLDLHEQKHRQ